MIKAKISKNVIKRNRNGKMNFVSNGKYSKYVVSTAITAVLAGITFKLMGGWSESISWIIFFEAVIVFVLFAYEKEGMNIVVYCYKVFTNNKDIRLFDKKSFLTSLTDRDRSGKK